MIEYPELTGTNEYCEGFDPCPICGKNRKFKYKKFGRKESIRICACDCKRDEIEKQHERDIQISKMLQERSFLKSKLTDKTFTRFKFSDDDGRNPKVTDFCKRYVEYIIKHKDERNFKFFNVIFYGNCGNGKSFYASCIANSLNDRDIATLMISLPELISHMNENRGQNEIKILNIIKNIPMLIIDDYGIELRNSANIEKMTKIFDSRYRSNKPLIITTNKFIDDLQMENDVNFARINRRILEKCKTILIDK